MNTLRGYNASKLRRKKPEPKHYKFMMSDQDCSSFVQTDNRNQMYNIRRNIAYTQKNCECPALQFINYTKYCHQAMAGQ